MVPSPCRLGLARAGHNENFLASDASAIVEHTKEVLYLQDGDLVAVRRDKSAQLRGYLPTAAAGVSKLDRRPLHTCRLAVCRCFQNYLEASGSTAMAFRGLVGVCAPFSCNMMSHHFETPVGTK